eukprot:5232363-Amphidinium_carterae.1
MQSDSQSHTDLRSAPGFPKESFDKAPHCGGFRMHMRGGFGGGRAPAGAGDGRPSFLGGMPERMGALGQNLCGA